MRSLSRPWPQAFSRPWTQWLSCSWARWLSWAFSKWPLSFFWFSERRRKWEGIDGTETKRESARSFPSHFGWCAWECWSHCEFHSDLLFPVEHHGPNHVGDHLRVHFPLSHSSFPIQHDGLNAKLPSEIPTPPSQSPWHSTHPILPCLFKFLCFRSEAFLKCEPSRSTISGLTRARSLFSLPTSSATLQWSSSSNSERK